MRSRLLHCSLAMGELVAALEDGEALDGVGGDGVDPGAGDTEPLAAEGDGCGSSGRLTVEVEGRRRCRDCCSVLWRRWDNG